MPPFSSLVWRGYFFLAVAFFALLYLSSAWVRWFRASSSSSPPPPLSPAESADAHYRKMRADLLRDNEMRQLTGDTRPKLWIFLDRHRNGRDWAGTQFRTNCALNRPYLRACIRSLRRHNDGAFRIVVVDDRAFQHLVPDWPFGDLAHIKGDVQRQSARVLGQLHLLYLYGGLTVPASFWCRRPLRPLFDAALAGGGGTPFCVDLPEATAVRPLMPPRGDAQRAFWPGDIGAEEVARSALPFPAPHITYLDRDGNGDNNSRNSNSSNRIKHFRSLGFFGCRPNCVQVQRLIEQTLFQANAVGESQELVFHRSSRAFGSSISGDGMASAMVPATLCAGRWTALPFELADSAENGAAVASPGSAFLAPNGRASAHRAALARFAAPSTSNPPSGVRRVGLHLLRTNGPWRELPGVPLVQAEVRSVHAGLVGRVDCRGDTVTLAQLLGATPVQFQEDAVGVWIPEDELLASKYYDWFPSMGLPAMRDKGGFVLAGLLGGELDGADARDDAEVWQRQQQQQEQQEDKFADADAAVNPFGAAMDIGVVGGGAPRKM